MAKRAIPLAKTVQGGRRHDYVNPPDPLGRQTPRPKPASALRARDWDRIAASAEVQRNRDEAATLNAEAVQVRVHMDICTDGSSGKCDLHDWVKGYPPYGWSTTEGGFLDYRNPDQSDKVAKGGQVPTPRPKSSRVTRKVQRHLDRPTTKAERKAHAKQRAADLKALDERIARREGK